MTARRVLLTTGMIDSSLDFDGFAQHWGRGVVQCPYCHGFENNARPWGYLVPPLHAAHALTFALQLLAWTDQLTVFTNGSDAMDDDCVAAMKKAGMRIEPSRIRRLSDTKTLEYVELENGERVACELFFAHPPQGQVPLVTSLGLELDEHGFVKTDVKKHETSAPGIYAAGDLCTNLQGAMLAAAAGTAAASVINVDLALDLIR